MSLATRIDTLKSRHVMVDAELQREEGRPAPNPAQVHRLKREKLRLKDEMNRLAIEMA